MSKNKIIIGWKLEEPLLTFEGSSILSVSGEQDCPVIATEIHSDYLEADIRSETSEGFYDVFGNAFHTLDGSHLYVTNSTLQSTQMWTPVFYLHGDRVISHTFTESIRQTSSNTYHLKTIGLMELYGTFECAANGPTTGTAKVNNFNWLIRNRTGYGFDRTGKIFEHLQEYCKTSSESDVNLTGIFLAGTARDAYQQLALATGSAYKLMPSNGVFMFSPISTNANTIDMSRVYIDIGVEYSDIPDRLELTCYRYTTGAAYQDLYASTEEEPTGRRLITYKLPIPKPQSYSTTGDLTVIKSGVGGAIVEGHGTFRAAPYKIETAVVVRGVDEESAKNILRIDGQLVSFESAETIADNIWNYVTINQKIKASIILDGETAGNCYQVPNAFGYSSNAHLEKFSFSGSGIVKCDCEFVPGFIPSVNSFANSIVLTGSGVFNVPSEVFDSDNPRIQVTVIGGGTGGQSGQAGRDGKNAAAYPTTAVYPTVFRTDEDKGRAGAGGSGGRILTSIIENPSRSYYYSCGIGGAGGIAPEEKNLQSYGKDGTATKFGDLTSDDGTRLSKGYCDLSTLKYYGKTTTNEGSSNGSLANELYDSLTGHQNGTSVYKKGYPGVATPPGLRQTFLPPNDWYWFPDNGISAPFKTYSSSYGWLNAYGGYGGGAAALANGKDGKLGSLSGDTFTTGNGGDGADATLPGAYILDYNPDAYGWGGCGGNGGGIGGDAGGYPQGVKFKSGTPGRGGRGGDGGRGAPGCVIIHW